MRQFQVSRLLTGPEVSGSRPVVVTFEVHRDREEVSPSCLLFEVAFLVTFAEPTLVFYIC